MINKNQFSIKNTKKVLHKVGKQWVVVSAVLLGLAAGGAAVTTANADATANASANHTTAVASMAPSSANSSAANPASTSANSASAGSSVSVAPSSVSTSSARPKMMLGGQRKTTFTSTDAINSAISAYSVGSIASDVLNYASANNAYSKLSSYATNAESALSAGTISGFISGMHLGSTASNIVNSLVSNQTNSGLSDAYNLVHSHRTETNSLLDNFKNITPNNAASNLSNFSTQVNNDVKSGGAFAGLNNLNDVASAASNEAHTITTNNTSAINSAISAYSVGSIASDVLNYASANNAYSKLSSYATNAESALSAGTISGFISGMHLGSTASNIVNSLVSNQTNSGLSDAYNLVHSHHTETNSLLDNFKNITSNNAASNLSNFSTQVNNDVKSGVFSGLNNLSGVASAASNEASQITSTSNESANNTFASEFATAAASLSSSDPSAYKSAVSELQSLPTALHSGDVASLSAYVNNFNSAISNLHISSNPDFTSFSTAVSDANTMFSSVAANSIMSSIPVTASRINKALSLAGLNSYVPLVNGLTKSGSASNAYKGIIRDLNANSVNASDLASDFNSLASNTNLPNVQNVFSAFNNSTANVSNTASELVNSKSASIASANSTASQNSNASAQNSSSASQVPYFPSFTSYNSAFASSVVTAPQSEYTTTSVVSKATKRNNHKVAGHYVNVPNKHITLNGVNRNAKFYMGKKAVKVSPKALKRAKVVEAVRKGHHVTYLVRVGKRAYTVRGYVKNVKPVFANAKRVTVHVGRRAYRVSPKNVRVISAVRRGANVTYSVKVNRKRGTVYAKVTKRVFVRNAARRSHVRRNHARKHVSASYYRSMKRGHYVRANENIWVHSHKNFTKRNAKFELRRGTVVYAKRLVRARGNVTRLAVRGGFVSARKSVVRLFK